MSTIIAEELQALSCCQLCPHHCGANRLEGQKGFCKADAGINISSICIHRGEEPVLDGINGVCNIFFGCCNLRCSFCQNYQISKPDLFYQSPSKYITYEQVVQEITDILNQGITHVGFVSPTHQIPQMKIIIRLLHEAGYHPIIIYNSNGYDLPEQLQQLENLIDIYLPDYKYGDDALAHNFSGISNYSSLALKAIKEMKRQKGTQIVLNEHDVAIKGLIIRHLVLPGCAENSTKALQMLAEEISPLLYLSIMSQYHPNPFVLKHPLLQYTLNFQEYQDVLDNMEALGFYRGWVQDFSSATHYNPDFKQEHPFEQ